jgi:hypothetical protein
MNARIGLLPAGLALATALAVSGCVAAPAGATPEPSAPGPSPSEGTPSGGPSGGAFYLRGWITQALAPQYTFGFMPPVTIGDSVLYDGMVAVPAIYPGPLYVGLSTRTISQAGIDRIVAEATARGLLGSQTQFGSTLPGGQTCHVRLVEGGVTHDLAGNCSRSAAGTSAAATAAAAFAGFWEKLTSTEMWLADTLGPSIAYTPERLAVMTIPPAEPSGPITPSQAAWPLAVPFASFGTPSGGNDYRCAIVSGGDLATLLPVVQAANALTRFTDSAGTVRSLQVRVLTPGDAGPCAA